MTKFHCHEWVSKGWGGEKWIVNNDLYCGKILYFMKGKRCSLHYHKNKHETFYIQSGKVIVYWSDNSVESVEKNAESIRNKMVYNSHEPTWFLGMLNYDILERGTSFVIHPGRIHQIVALEDTELFEFSTHHEDSDSYRIVKGN